MKGALTRYRIMAYIVGVLLLLLVFVDIPAKYIWHNESFAFIAIAHGWMFLIYLVTVVDLSLRCRWSIFPRVVLIAIAGVVPFLSFYAEHKATGWARQAIAASEGESGTRGSDTPSAVADN